MKPKYRWKLAAGALAVLMSAAASASAAVLIEVDMDSVAPGVQSERFASAGDTFTATLLVTSDAAGLSSYGISVDFDTGELSLDGSPASTELLPAGFAFNLSAGVLSESNALGQVRTFEAATFGLGPVGATFAIGTIKYKVLTPVDDGIVDVSVGLFNAGIDGLFDNASGDVSGTAVFTGGKVRVVPEPAGAALVAAGLCALGVARRRRGA